MWLINVVIIFSYFCIVLALAYKAKKSKETIDIAIILISFVFELVFLYGILSKKEYSNTIQTLILIFGYLIPIILIYLKYTTISIKLKLVYIISNFLYYIRKYELANMLIEKIIKKDDKNIKYYELAAKSYKKQNKYLEARDMYFKIAELDNGKSDAYFNLGIIFDLLNKKDTAIIMFANAITIDPNFVEAKEMKGIIYSEIGRHLEATNIYEELKEEGTKNYKIYYNLATIYLENGDIDKAKENYEQAVLLNKNLHEAWYTLGNIYYMRSDYQAALVAFKKSNIDKNLKAKTNYSLAKVYMKTEDYVSAVESIEIAAKLNNDYILKATKDELFEPIIPEINRIKDDLISLEVAEYIPCEDIEQQNI